MSITRSLVVEDLQVLLSLVFINREVEVALSFNLSIDICCQSQFLLLIQFFLELQEINLLSDELSDFVLNVLKVMVVVIFDFTDLSEDLFLLVDVSKASKPLSLGSFLLKSLSDHNFRLLSSSHILCMSSVNCSLSPDRF